MKNVLFTTAFAAIVMMASPALADNGFNNNNTTPQNNGFIQPVPAPVTSTNINVSGGNSPIDFGAIIGAQGKEARRLAQAQFGYQVVGTIVSDISGGIQDRRTITHQTDETIRLRTAETGLQERFLVFQNNLQSQPTGGQSSTMCPNGQPPSATADGGKYCRIN
jgi:uncharacterized protein YdeI (BOF family)